MLILHSIVLDDHTGHFPKLNDVNYTKWSIRMEAELICHGLWAQVEIVIDEDGKDATSIQMVYMVKKSN